jgi:septal ring-binding cell division protein DamX
MIQDLGASRSLPHNTGSRRVEVRRHAERGQRHERAHVVWLSLGLLVAFGLTFALGFMVGRRAERSEPRPQTSDGLAMADSDSTPPDPLTFYGKLTDEAVAPSAAEIATAPKPGAHAPADTAPAEGSAAPSLAPKPAGSAAEPNKTERLAGAVARVRHAAKAEPDKPQPGPAKGRTDVINGLASGPASSGDFTVQVSAFQSLGEAKAYAAGLERKGYRPFVVTSSLSGKSGKASSGTWYRVRIGRFGNKAQADEAKSLLARADIPGWVLQAE